MGDLVASWTPLAVPVLEVLLPLAAALGVLFASTRTGRQDKHRNGQPAQAEGRHADQDAGAGAGQVLRAGRDQQPPTAPPSITAADPAGQGSAAMPAQVLGTGTGTGAGAPTSARSRASRSAAVLTSLGALALVLASAVWVVGRDHSASRWAELQLLWMAPTLGWAGLAAALSAPGRPASGKLRRRRTRPGLPGPQRRSVLRPVRSATSQATAAAGPGGTAADHPGAVSAMSLPTYGLSLPAGGPSQAPSEPSNKPLHKPSSEPSGKPRRLVRPLVVFAALFTAGTAGSWLSALAPVQLLVLAPRQVSWPLHAQLPLGQWLELVLPALTTFHGRMITWAPNRVLLVLAGLTWCWMAQRRWRAYHREVLTAAPAAPDVISPRSWRVSASGLPSAAAAVVGAAGNGGGMRVVAGAAAALVAGCAVLALWWPTQAATWRLGWSEGRLQVPVAALDPSAGTIEVSYLLHPAIEGSGATVDGSRAGQSGDEGVLLTAGSTSTTATTSTTPAATVSATTSQKGPAGSAGDGRGPGQDPSRWSGAPVIVAAVGGPSAASQTRTQLLKALGPVGRTHDVLISDYRGFGRSHPIGCPGVDVGAATPAAVATCQHRLGALGDNLSAARAAEDLEAVRTALGIDRWDLYGQSYGTFFAQTYARAHPASVHAMVLDSSLPLGGPPTWTFMADALPGPADPAAWAQVVAQARAQGWTSPSVAQLATVQLYGAWPEVAGPRDVALRLPPAPRQAALAQLGANLGAQLAAMRADPFARLVPAPAQGVYACNDFPMPFERQTDPQARQAATRAYGEEHLSADIAPFTWAEMDHAARAANGLEVHTFRYEACLYWRYHGQYPGQSPQLNPGAVEHQDHQQDHQQNRQADHQQEDGTPAAGSKAGVGPAGDASSAGTGEVPVLVVSGAKDTTTTPAMAAGVAASWGAPVLSVRDGDHFVLLDSSCAREAVAAFVGDPTATPPAQCGPRS